MAPDLDVTPPYGSVAGTGHPVCALAVVGTLVFGDGKECTKKRDTPVSGLMWPPFRDVKQQPTQWIIFLGASTYLVKIRLSSVKK